MCYAALLLLEVYQRSGGLPVCRWQKRILDVTDGGFTGFSMML